MIKILILLGDLFNLIPKKELNKKKGGEKMPELLLKKAEWETNHNWSNPSRDNNNDLSQEQIKARIAILKERQKNLPGIVEEKINNALKPEFHKKNDYIFFMNQNQETITNYKNEIIQKHTKETKERLKNLKSLLDN